MDESYSHQYSKKENNIIEEDVIQVPKNIDDLDRMILRGTQKSGGNFDEIITNSEAQQEEVIENSKKDLPTPQGPSTIEVPGNMDDLDRLILQIE